MQLNATADKDYRLYIEAPRVPQELAVDADIPRGIEEFLHMAIVWRAILYYGMYHNDPATIEYAKTRYRPYKKRLERVHMPDVLLHKHSLRTR